MRRAVKRAGVLVAASALAAIALPGTASAIEVPTWVDNPGSCTSVVTVSSKTSGDRFLQLRKGWCGKGWYIWARANENYRVELGINRNGENIGTNSTQNGSGSTHYTKGRRADSGLIFVGDTSWTTPIGYAT
jgi:hypothetical protein